MQCHGRGALWRATSYLQLTLKLRVVNCFIFTLVRDVRAAIFPAAGTHPPSLPTVTLPLADKPGNHIVGAQRRFDVATLLHWTGSTMQCQSGPAQILGHRYN